MGASDLRVTVDGVKLRCVLDPPLVLGHAWGRPLALGLTRVFETWLPRSFWRVLDASELISLDTEAAPWLHPLALSDWTALRDGTDAGSWPMRWVGDNLHESQLRSSADDSLLERFERHAEALEPPAPAPEGAAWACGFDPVGSSHDALALSAALDGALILCQAADAQTAPGPVKALARLGHFPHELPADESRSLMAAERQFVREAVAAAGLAALLQSLGHLCVVHALTLPPAREAANDAGHNPWRRSQSWWYRL
ncbi:MAG: hypothetical protein EKK52_15535 [Burkholderiales bacterium]|uniref:hypothetical protein n=1 Tax=Roseateles sp. TaxID=1971397 RepID=UPI000FB0F34C|nr:MAG: hypothetical protein EKK52_15535 [Burkholderiales bacterium]